jgi:hypothetical protein
MFLTPLEEVKRPARWLKVSVGEERLNCVALPPTPCTVRLLFALSPTMVRVWVRPEKLTVKLLGVSRPSRRSRRGRKRWRRGVIARLLYSRVRGLVRNVPTSGLFEQI